MLSRKPGGEPTIEVPFQIGEWTIEPALDEISRDGNVVKLEPRMMRLLCRLAETSGDVVSSVQLLDSVWPGVVVGPASVYQAISALRKILGDTAVPPNYISTVARKGYRLVAPVELRPKPTTPTVAAVRKFRFTDVGMIALAAGVLVVAVAMGMVVASTRSPAVAVQESVAPAWPSADLPSIVPLPLQPRSASEQDKFFAAAMTDILHNRLASQHSLLVVSWYSAGKLSESGLDVGTIGRRLHARYVLRGDAGHSSGSLLIHLSLVDSTTGAELWAQDYSRPESGAAALREDIVARVGATLNAKIDPVGNHTVDVAAYELYMRGLGEYLKLNKEGFDAAYDIFLRATTLYPEFSRGYFGLAIALRQMPYYSKPWNPGAGEGSTEQAISALDRAIALDPEFGEALIDRAEYEGDAVEAERLFRRGMELIPNYDIGAYKYGWFLCGHLRIGEGIAMFDRGLRVDPLSDMLLQTKSDILMYHRGDVAGSEALLRELLSIHPNDPGASTALGWSRYLWSGDTAESIGIFERAVARDPTSAYIRRLAAIAYLDVDDLRAATAVANDSSIARLEIAQYRREAHPLSNIPAEQRQWDWGAWNWTSVDPVSEAIRDEALATRNYAAAINAFEEVRATPGLMAMQKRGNDLAYASTLILAGDVDRGRAIAKAVLKSAVTDQIGRPPHWLARTRAAAFALLGDDERALAELEDSMRHGDYIRWWYTGEVDPTFAHLHRNPRFQALVAEARRHRMEQRALVDEMKRSGEIPTR